jgi:acetylornithine deacetylase
MSKPPKLQSMLHQLIAAPSISSVSPDWDQSNLAVIELLAAWLGDLGMQVETLPIAGFPGKFNLIASTGSGPGGLVLSGHSDTVPCDPQRWRSDPFRLQERDNRLYGLGSADMKSFLGLVVEALREVPLKRLQRPLVVIATADEESNMCGARQIVDLGRQLGRQVVIGEPTGLRPVRSHKGIGMESIRLRGRAGHSSNPALGNSALEGMHQVISALLRWRTELQQAHQDPLFEVPVPTVNLGHVHGGDNPNRICGECELHIDMRPLPGMSLEGLRADLADRLGPISQRLGLELQIRPLFEGIPPMETPASAEIVRVVEQLSGYPAGAVAFGTEGPFFNAMGMDALIFGPGSIDQAHQPDEFLDMAQINPAVSMLRSLVRHFCA